MNRFKDFPKISILFSKCRNRMQILSNLIFYFSIKCRHFILYFLFLDRMLIILNSRFAINYLSNSRSALFAKSNMVATDINLFRMIPLSNITVISTRKLSSDPILNILDCLFICNNKVCDHDILPVVFSFTDVSRMPNSKFRIVVRANAFIRMLNGNRLVLERGKSFT